MKEKAFYKVGHEFCFTHVQVYFDCRLLLLFADYLYTLCEVRKGI